ncbi:MAG TPA: AMP-binding protein [Chloroflexota bacterium]|jgi:long-chain acyl-CoA synthetase|nr:AMP-binding protein [Chloroflexota bacterium]
MALDPSVQTVPEIVLRARERFGALPAMTLRDPRRGFTWTYDELVAYAAGVARWLAAQGIGHGDRVILWGPSQPIWGGVYYGCLLVGAIVVPLDFRSAPDFVARVVAKTRPKLQIVGPTQQPASTVPAVRFADLPPLDPTLPTPRPLATPDDLAVVVFTSGTTGVPKGVMLTHRNIVSNVRAILEVVQSEPRYRLLSILPLSHMFEQTVGLNAVLSGGASLVYLGTLRPETIFEALGAERITCMLVVPQVLQLFMQAIEREVRRSGRERVWRWLHRVAPYLPLAARRRLFRPVHERLGGRLEWFASGGAYLDPRLWRKWENLGIKVINAYGTTEAAPAITANSLERRNPYSVGRPLSCNAVRIAEDQEILVRGPNITPGYWEDPAATAAAFRDGWYCTGDLGRLRAGELYLIGRKKNLIVLPSGENVYPEDIENLLLQEPSITDAVVLGLPRPDGDIEVHAVLLTEAPQEALAAVKRVNRKLALHQRVRGTTIWPDADFPRTLTMKPRRDDILARLRALEAEGRAAPRG